MLTRDELDTMLEKIDAAHVCDHDPSVMAICEHCGDTVKCGICDDTGCQCWNDD